MKTTILIISLFIGIVCKAQIPIPIHDTNAVYGYLFITDSIGFVNTEYLVRTSLLEHGGQMTIWSYPAKDTTTNLVFACETPDTPRLSNFSELIPIKPAIIQFANGEISLSDLKTIADASSINKEYKDLINSIQLINRKKYKTDINFINFKPLF